ncbi:MAG TPA: phosphodiesterase [Pilimelia sp.]|nr:phosphodiesterase [Pilimelia sp.]
MPHPLSAVEDAVRTGAEAAARAVAAVRRARAVHPRGRTFRAILRTRGGGGYGVDLLDRPGEYPTLVRLSRGAGLPPAWPDVLGVALRVTGAGGPGADLDLLFSTTADDAPLARHLPLPRRRPDAVYTTVSGYRTRRGRRYLAVRPDPTAGGAAAVPAALLLAVATRYGPWRVFGRITLDAPLPADADAEVAFDPVRHRCAGLDPDGLLWRLRAAAYRGSRHGRGLR